MLSIVDVGFGSVVNLSYSMLYSKFTTTRSKWSLSFNSGPTGNADPKLPVWQIVLIGLSIGARNLKECFSVK